MPPPEESPTRTLQVALSAMALVALTLGLVVGGLVLGISRYAGVDDVAQAQAQQAPATMSIPPYHKTPVGKDPGVKTYPPSPTPSVDLPTTQPSTVVGAGAGIALVVSPLQVGPGQQINLSGSYGREGASLQVQRREGGGPWTDFPVSTTVANGTFGTWIVTSLTGTVEFRVIDGATGAVSNPVTVTIR